MSTTTENLKLFKYDVVNDKDTAFSITDSLNNNWDKIDEAYGKSRRNIGEIVQSTIPLNDAGLHLLDGSLLAYGSYKEFIDYIASIYDVRENFFCSESDWQASVTTYGVCGKFVYNGGNNTVRLPKITGFIEGSDITSTLGDLTEAGLPNILGTFGKVMCPSDYSSSGAFSDNQQGAASITGSGQTKRALDTFSFDASNGGSTIYGNSTTVQPQSIKVLYYIVVANSTKTDIEVDIDEIATDLNGKADVDGSNMVSSVKNFDGQWIAKYSTLFNDTTAGTSVLQLYDYLPNDNYTYEVKIRCAMVYNSAKAGLTLTDAFTIGVVLQVDTNDRSDRAYINVIIDSSRSLGIQLSAAATTCLIEAKGYRRLGTNS